jgi:hypothetical protein
MGIKTEEEAKKSPYQPLVIPQPYSFELDMDMLGLLRKEFDPPLIVGEFAKSLAEKGNQKIDQVAETVFGKYGQDWMRKAIQLGEEYPDRTYEVLKEVAEKTGELYFPLVLQRFIEIAYLGTQQYRKLDIVENWSERLVYDVKDCYTFKTLKEKCGAEVANRWPCQHACLSALRIVAQELNLGFGVEMEATMVKDGHCQFAMTKR